LNKLSDGRVNPTYSTGQVILPVLFGFLLRMKSFNELSLMIKNREFSQLFPRGTKLPQIDAIRDTLKVMDIDSTLASTTVNPLISLVFLPISKVYQIRSF